MQLKMSRVKTVGELKQKLSEFPDNTEIMLQLGWYEKGSFSCAASHSGNEVSVYSMMNCCVIENDEFKDATVFHY